MPTARKQLLDIDETKAQQLKMQQLKALEHCKSNMMSWPQEADQLDNAVNVVIHVATGLPQHVDQRGVVLAVQRNVLRQLRTEAEVWNADHAAPGRGAFHRSAFRLRRLRYTSQRSVRQCDNYNRKQYRWCSKIVSYEFIWIRT